MESITDRRSRLAPRAHPGPLFRVWLVAAWVGAAALPGCGPGEPEAAPAAEAPTASNAAPTPLDLGLSADARIDTWAMLVEDVEAERHPSDGGGSAWLDLDPSPRVPAASPARLPVVFETGPLGVAEGGAVFLQPSPFWDWDPPQTRYPDAPGYTTVSTDAEGVELEADDATNAFLAVTIRGRALRPGEQLRFVYGDGEVGARVDRFAEERSPLYVSVDGDGDGVRATVRNGPRVDVAAHAPRQLHAAIDSTAARGAPVRLVVAALDALGNATRVEHGGVAFVDPPAGTKLPSSIDLSGDAEGHRTLVVEGLPAGIHRLELRGTGDLSGMAATTNPVVVRDGVERVLWADLHGHSQLSDGTGTPDQYYGYARDVAGLDVSALTDHDHWGMTQLDADPEAWATIRESVERFHEPGSFVALLGYEWTSWLHGHRHVLYFDQHDDRQVLSSLDPEYETPAQLWDALRGQDALTFAHHSAGGPVSTNWRFYPPDPELEPVTEVVSVHGSSEAPDSPHPIYDPVPGNFVRDVIEAGYVLGFIGSGDSHDGHPGLVHLADAGGAGGLAAIRSEELTRDGVLEALRARRTYATDGSRIWLDVRIDDRAMGEMIGVDPERSESHTLAIEIAGTAPIDHVDLIRSGHTARIDGEGRLDLAITREIPPLAPGEYHYVRVVQTDGRAAWSSPIFARLPE